MIVLPTAKSVRRLLEAKLEEYKGRLREENPYRHPELSRKLIVGTVLGYKIDILESLLEKGELNMHDFSLELFERQGTFGVDNYNQAAGVIDDYCKTGGRNVDGGTGLQDAVSS